VGQPNPLPPPGVVDDNYVVDRLPRVPIDALRFGSRQRGDRPRRRLVLVQQLRNANRLHQILGADLASTEIGQVALEDIANSLRVRGFVERLDQFTLNVLDERRRARLSNLNAAEFVLATIPAPAEVLRQRTGVVVPTRDERDPVEGALVLQPDVGRLGEFGGELF
jgi:hypothetical protein